MNQLEIRSFSSPDVDTENWAPTSANDVCFLLEVEIGELGDERVDLFQVVVATPKALPRLRRAGEVLISDRATIVMMDFSWPSLRRVLDDILAACSSQSWGESVLRLQRYFRWEYEDYSEDF